MALPHFFLDYPSSSLLELRSGGDSQTFHPIQSGYEL